MRQSIVNLSACGALLMGTLWASEATAQPALTVAASPTSAEGAPRIALVLSGGGARGFAHVGVLRVLKQLRVPVDIIVGASMGAVVGGAYAAGRSVEELEAFVRGTDWDNVVADRSQRQDLSFRRKEDDLEVPSHIEFGVTRAGVSLPPAAAGNAAVEDALARLLPTEARARPTGALPLRFRAVATDLLTGELVELSDTPLAQSLRASMAVPGVFAPLRVGERLVVDGGLVRNLPVDLARAMGATVVIAVNVGTPLAGESELGSAFGVAQQMINILTEQNVQRSLKELTAQDILIAPDMRGVSFLDFRAAGRAIAAGEKAAMAMADRLRELSAPLAAYAAFEALRSTRSNAPDVARPLVKLDVRGTTHTSAQALAVETGLEIGQLITLREAERAAELLRGRGDFERVDVEVRDTLAGRELTITPSDADWARSRMRMGLELSSDFRDDHRFTLSGLHVFSWLNNWGGELRSIARIGSTRLISTEWWQPLGAGSLWYTSATLGHMARSQDTFDQGLRQGRVSISASTASVALGHTLGRNGDLRVGIQRNQGVGKLLLPITTSDTTHFGESNAFALLRYDSLESLAFPTSGGLLTARWERGRATVPGEPSLAQSFVQGLSAFSLGDWGGHVYGEWAKSRTGFAPLSLGGFLRLSGAPRDSINGGTVLLGRAVLARRIGQMPAGLGGAVRVGMSLEAGEGFAASEAVNITRLRPAGSAFVSVDTRFGPAYLALGASKARGSTVYVFLGPFW